MPMLDDKAFRDAGGARISLWRAFQMCSVLPSTTHDIEVKSISVQAIFEISADLGLAPTPTPNNFFPLIDDEQ